MGVSRLPRRLCTVRRSGFINHVPFGRALRRFLLSREPLALLPECGWLDGGCLVLRDALVTWGQGALHPGATLRSNGERLFVDHGFTWLELGGRRVIVDGDGVQDEHGLRRKLELLEHIRPEAVQYADCSAFVVGILRDPSLSDRLAHLLEKRFGQFRPHLLTRH